MHSAVRTWSAVVHVFCRTLSTISICLSHLMLYFNIRLTKSSLYLELAPMAAGKKGHIVMIPFMAQGHIIPFLALARQIQQRTTSFTITIANTPLNIQYLRSSLSSPNEIHLAELPFNSTQHGLPPNIENTEKLPLTHIAKLFLSTLSLEAPLRSLISQITEQEGHPPLCIISDVY